MSETTETPAPQAAAPAVASIDAIVAKYIALRDKKADLKKAYEAQVETIDQAMEKCEAYFLTVMRAQGLESLPTKAGTPYKTTRSSVSIADPGQYWDWVMEDLENRRAFLDLKANKTAVVAFREEHADLPPGLNYSEAVVVNVRR